METTGWADDGWFYAPRDRTLTADERLNCAKRLIMANGNVGRLRVAVVYEHGTIVMCSIDSTSDPDSVMRSYNFPSDGAGGAGGDIGPAVEFDDGTVMFDWGFPESSGGPGRDRVWSVVGAFEGKDVPKLPIKEARLCALGLVARRKRTLDAKDLKQAASWSPEAG